jgi:hypothetical protein
VGQVKRDTTGTHVRRVHARTRDTLVKLHELFTLLETPQEWGERTDVHGVGEHGHQVVEDTRNLAHERTDPLGTVGNLNVEQLLNSEGVRKLVGHCEECQHLVQQ